MPSAQGLYLLLFGKPQLVLSLLNERTAVKILMSSIFHKMIKVIITSFCSFFGCVSEKALIVSEVPEI